MPFPRRLTHVANRYVNPVMGRVAGRVPPFALVIHRGRRTGAIHRNPVIMRPAGGRLVVALTYGSRVNWVRNVMAAGGCEVVRRGRRLTAVDPRIERHVEPPRLFSPLERPILRRAGVTEFLVLRPVAGTVSR